MKEIQRIIAESVLAALKAGRYTLTDADGRPAGPIVTAVVAKSIAANAVMAMQADEPIELPWSPAQGVRK